MRKPRFKLLVLALASFSFLHLARAEGFDSGFSVDALSNGKDAALRVCDGLSMSSSKRECVALVGESRYFDTDALPLCSSFSMNSRVVECMQVIRDRRYTAQEVRTCSSESFDSDKVECMGRLGEEYAPPAGGTLRSELERVLRYMDSGDLTSARRNLIRVIDTLDAP